MIIRLRSRDGLERVEIDDNTNVAGMIRTIAGQLNLPVENIRVSRQQGLLLSKTPEQYADLSDKQKSLKSLNFANGELVYLWYSGERSVASTVPRSMLETRPFGNHMTIEQLVARQVRIEQQKEPGCASVSFDRHAANVFQGYCQEALGFSIKRGGLCYGSVDDSGNVLVEAIYEPQQQGSADSLLLQRGTDEEDIADFIADKLGLQKVGWIFTQSLQERSFIMSAEEICQICQIQDELGEKAVTAVVSMEAEDGQSAVHFEAFQTSKQAVQLWKDGWFQPGPEPSSLMKVRNPQHPDDESPAIVHHKDVGDVDNDLFLCPVPILDHAGPLLTSFPIENRLIPQGKPELKQHLNKHPEMTYTQRISDFHLLLWLAKQSNFERSDMALLVDAVKAKRPVLDGYRFIINSIAGISTDTD